MTTTYRTRQEGALVPLAYSWCWWDNQNPIPPKSTITNSQQRGTSRLMRDYVTPNFRKLQAEGGIVNTPMESSEVTVSGGDSGWKFVNNANPPWIYYGEHDGNWLSHVLGVPAKPTIDQGLKDALRAMAATEAWAKVDTSDIQGLAMLGEIRQTLNLLGDPVRAFSKFFFEKAWADADWKKARGKRAKDRAAAKLLSNLWLQYQYGFRPILMDIEAIVAELQNQTFNPRRTARATKTHNVSSVTPMTPWLRGAIETDISYRTQSSYVVRAGILYEARVSPVKQFGLHWTSLPAAAWELTPWSFVVDWFLNVGDFLQAYVNSTVGVNVLAAWTSDDEQHTVTRTSGAARLVVAGWSTVKSPYGSETASYRNRTRIPSVESPSLTFESPLQAIMKGNRGLNAYTLFLQQFIKPQKRVMNERFGV